MNKQFPLPLPHQETMGSDDFFSSPCNIEALQWIDVWPKWPEPFLIIHGPQGSGKTHLAHLFKNKSSAHLITHQEIDHGDIRKMATDHQALIVDDIMTMLSRSPIEENIFHLMNVVREKKKYLLLTATLPPAHWHIKLKDLRSRLLSSPHVAIALPDDSLLSAVMVKLFHDRQLTVNEEVLNYLLPRIERTFSAAIKVVRAIDKASLAERRGITVAFVKRVLEEDRFLTKENALE